MTLYDLVIRDLPDNLDLSWCATDLALPDVDLGSADVAWPQEVHNVEIDAERVSA